MKNYISKFVIIRIFMVAAVTTLRQCFSLFSELYSTFCQNCTWLGFCSLLKSIICVCNLFDLQKNYFQKSTNRPLLQSIGQTFLHWSVTRFLFDLDMMISLVVVVAAAETACLVPRFKSQECSYFYGFKQEIPGRQSDRLSRDAPRRMGCRCRDCNCLLQMGRCCASRDLAISIVKLGHDGACLPGKSTVLIGYGRRRFLQHLIHCILN